MTTIAPDRMVNVTCKTCPASAEPIAEVSWHSSDPGHTVESAGIGGLAATLLGSQTHYSLRCENHGHVGAKGVTLSKAELIERCESAWTQRQPISI